jgi:hypothetical protein
VGPNEMKGSRRRPAEKRGFVVMMTRNREQRGDRDRPEIGDSQDVLGPIIAEMKTPRVLLRRRAAVDTFNQKREGGVNCQEKKST